MTRLSEWIRVTALCRRVDQPPRFNNKWVKEASQTGFPPPCYAFTICKYSLTTCEREEWGSCWVVTNSPLLMGLYSYNPFNEAMGECSCVYTQIHSRHPSQPVCVYDLDRWKKGITGLGLSRFLPKTTKKQTHLPRWTVAMQSSHPCWGPGRHHRWA